MALPNTADESKRLKVSVNGLSSNLFEVMKMVVFIAFVDAHMSADGVPTINTEHPFPKKHKEHAKTITGGHDHQLESLEFMYNDVATTNRISISDLYQGCRAHPTVNNILYISDYFRHCVNPVNALDAMMQMLNNKNPCVYYEIVIKAMNYKYANFHITPEYIASVEQIFSKNQTQLNPYLVDCENKMCFIRKQESDLYGDLNVVYDPKYSDQKKEQEDMIETNRRELEILWDDKIYSHFTHLKKM